jgi:carbon monoxide dehydrogenase subunit G
MDFKGAYTIAAPPDMIWAALHDPDILKACIPGAESVSRVSETAYTAKAMMKVGPVKARFEGKVEWADAPAEEGYAYSGILKGEGQGGAAGFARGESIVRLKTDGAGTQLTYDAKATIGGRLAQVGQRLIDSVAKSMADEFFAKFAALMRAGSEQVGTEPAPSGREILDIADERKDDGLAPQIWVAGLVAIVILLLVLFSVVL